MQVVGVVEDVRNRSPDRDANPDIFVDYRQLMALSRQWGDSAQRQDEMAIGFVSFAIRTRSDRVQPRRRSARVCGLSSMRRRRHHADGSALANSIARPRFYAVLGMLPASLKVFSR